MVTFKLAKHIPFSPQHASLWDRVSLDEVRKGWEEYQHLQEMIRDKAPVYRYLHMVFEQVKWWRQCPKERKAALRDARGKHPEMQFPADMYATVMMLTADPSKIDRRMRSKWVRALRYAQKCKKERELLSDFLKRKGGINKCAARYARRLR